MSRDNHFVDGMQKLNADLEYRTPNQGKPLAQIVLPREQAQAIAEFVNQLHREVKAERDELQRRVFEWGKICFGVDHMQDHVVRAVRFFEEAAELTQAAGVGKAHAQRAFDYVYSRASGSVPQEMGGCCNTLYALAECFGLSLHDCEKAEIDRCLATPPEQFAERNGVKRRVIDEQFAPTPREVAEFNAKARMKQRGAQGDKAEAPAGETTTPTSER